MAYEGNHLSNEPAAQLVWRRRQIRIARAVLAGATLASVGEQEGVTGERIAQIFRIACVQAARLPEPAVELPDHFSRIEGIRAHKRFWRRRLAALERFWRLPKENGKAGSARPSRPSARRRVAAPEHSADRRGSPGPRLTRKLRKTRHGK
jgi:hypothetical protein